MKNATGQFDARRLSIRFMAAAESQQKRWLDRVPEECPDKTKMVEESDSRHLRKVGS